MKQYYNFSKVRFNEMEEEIKINEGKRENGKIITIAS